MRSSINYIIALFFIFSSTFLVGQIGGGGPPGSGGPPCWPPPCVPVDGGIGILIAVGAFFGYKSFFGLPKNKN